ncbi:hypothetical protein LTR78_002774 [Recurvomyces mirabilis]|uniref:HIT-type domain-containing protein n=1 Tax=Recurvomyces mirabilis TaxID=574656 RepID=A0AAE0WSH4_9PEZI|nr:hypothetical protein LTR78_002774 [Recurvomyces mirabilis]KAK5159492.1 hypothetical protein LTS14_002634 [Recurvomyces mirabilis]
MATGPLRFRTPHIDELPATQSRQAPGFAWVAVSGAQNDPSKSWGTTNRKRARASVGGQTDQQREALSARQQREVERRIRDLNSDNSKDVVIELPRKPGTASAVKAGKTTNTKKILASGKNFAHYLDDEEAEIARTGRREGEGEALPQPQRASKTPLARRKTREDSSMSISPAPSSNSMGPPPLPRGVNGSAGASMQDDNAEEDDDYSFGMPSEADIEALLSLPPLTYSQARAAPPPPTVPPRRRFCETCGYWGRVKCMKCGTMTCSVACKDVHDLDRCLKMYA